MQINDFFMKFKQVSANFLRGEIQTLHKESKSKMSGDILTDISTVTNSDDEVIIDFLARIFMTNLNS